MTLRQGFADQMGQLLGPRPPGDIGLAVSGGSDSMALMHLAAGWARDRGVTLWVVTVDHGLRPAAAQEAQQVAQAAAGLGLSHATLKWTGHDGQGNLQDAARRARLALFSRWRGRVGHILLGHTADDQAETILMRLARGSGVEGLSGMAARRIVADIAPPGDLADAPDDAPARSAGWPPREARKSGNFEILRPLLGLSRAQLREFLQDLGVGWVDDPSNDDLRFDRVRARKALALLAPLGVTPAGLNQTGARLARAREALDRRAHQVACAIVTQEDGDLIFDRAGLQQTERDTQLRLLAAALKWVSSADYRPRAQPLEQALLAALARKSATLHGCLIHSGKTHLRVTREYAAVATLACPAGPGHLWDRRWLAQGPDIKGFELRALGPEGLARIGPPPPGSAPRAALAAVPALWDGEDLIACQRLGFGPRYSETLCPPAGPFHATFLSH